MAVRKILWLCCLIPLTCFAQKSLNVYVWGGEIPLSLIKKFERETKIQVNFSTFESNEALFAKLKTNHDFDVVLPSSYMVEKLIRSHALLPLDKSKISNMKNISESFMHLDFDKSNTYSLPLTWGATGIFNNKKFHPALAHWHNLWQPIYKNQLLLMDDAREVFAVSLISLGYSPNDTNPTHLKQAYAHLLTLQPNIKLMSANTVQGLIIDEEATLGVAWNGDIFKVFNENKNIRFSLPEEGFALWIDCLAILKKAPHTVEAHQFLNFMFDGKNAAIAIEKESMPSPNMAAKQYLPNHIQNSPLMFPNDAIIKKGTVLADIGPKATKQLLAYWQKFKLNF